jgi:hypothetical protein
MMDRRGIAAVVAVSLLMLGMVLLGVSPQGQAPSVQSSAALPVSSSARGVVAIVPTPSAGVAKAAPSSRQTASREPPPVPFLFLGKIVEDGETNILLYATGRTFKVRGIGPLDDDYDVAEIHADHLVLRYLPLNARQFVGLSSRGVVIGGLPEDSQQD